MPQPLDRVVKNPNASIFGVLSETGPGAWQNPKVSQIVAEIIARWATIDHTLNRLAVVAMGADPTVALAVFDKLTSDGLQRVARQAAADVSLSEDDLELFNAVSNVVDSIYKQRNKIAHWLWGYCAELPPDSLLLANPATLKKFDRERRAGKFKEMPDFSHVLVYSLTELEQLLTDVRETVVSVNYLENYLNPSSPMSRDQTLYTLLTSRLVRAEVDRLRESQKKSPRPTPPKPS